MAIDVLPWPTKSSDLNIIENVWGWLAMEVYSGFRQFENMDDLKEAIVFAWEKITPKRIEKLYESMPRRLADVIIKRGSATSY